MPPKGGNVLSTEESRQAIAVFRFEVIAPLVVRPLQPGERSHLLLELSNRLWKTPDGRVIRIHQRTIARWVARYRERGFAGLLPEVRLDHGHHRLLSDEVLAKAILLRQEDPERSIQAIIRILELEGVVEVGQVKRTTLSHALCRAGASRAEVSRSKETFRLRESPYPNAMWQIDTQEALRIPDASGRRRTLYLVAAIDDYSRHVVARFYTADNRPSLADLLKRAIIQRGRPEILYADNGANYRSRLLALACAQLGIELRHAQPYRPQGKGKIERWFKTADIRHNREAQALIDSGRIKTLEEVQEFFSAWLQNEYNSRIHSATKEAPNDRIRRVDPAHPLLWVSPDELAKAFLAVETRVVTSVGTISLEGNEYQVDPRLSRQKVTVRFDPYDLTHVFVERDGTSYGEASPVNLLSEERRELPRKESEERPERTSFLALVRAEDELRRFKEAGRMSFAQKDPGDRP